jgi:branched-chain amino acid transport system permease protein
MPQRAGGPGAVNPRHTTLGPGWSRPDTDALNAALALVVDALLFRHLRARNSTVIIMVMASFGAALTLRNLLEFTFTGRQQYFTQELQIAVRLGGGIRATPDQMLALAVAVLVVVGVHLLLSRTAIGRSMRAVSENPQLAGLAGVNVRQVIRIVWVLGAGLAAVAGVIAGLLVQIRPQMGLDLLLPLFAAAILGGIGSVPGAMFAGLIIGISEAVAVAAVGAQWRAAVSFVILVAVLLVRPQGLFGRAE